MKQLHAMILLSALVAGALLGVTMAQTMSAPLNAFSTSILGQPIYLYNPATDSIITPSGHGNGLSMIQWEYFDNTTMQWTITVYTTVPLTYYISAVSPQAAGCAAGTTAHWNGPKKSAVTTLCTPNTSAYMNFLILEGADDSNFLFSPYLNAAACVTALNGVPTIPGNVCNPLGPYVQWQLVTISP